MILKDKTLLITGILTDKSIAFATAKIAIDNGCERVRCYQSGDYIRIIIFEYNEETIQTKVINSLKDYTDIHNKAFTFKMTTVRGNLLSDSHLK